jgi:hypothetical protein
VDVKTAAAAAAVEDSMEVSQLVHTTVEEEEEG